MSTEKFSILTKGCILLCLTLLSLCPMPTDALPTHLSRRQQDSFWENPGSVLDFLDSIPGWVFGAGAVGTAGELGASQLPDSGSMTILPQNIQEEQPLSGVKSPESTGPTSVPATQPSEDQSFYGAPKPVGDPASEVDVPSKQPDLGTVWVPKSRFGGQ